MVKILWSAISLPRSQVKERRSYHGSRVLAWDLEKHRKASMTLDERCDVCVVGAGEKVSFPVAWHGAILGLGRPLADGNRIDDLSQSALGGAALGLAHLPRCTQVRHQLLLSTPRIVGSTEKAAALGDRRWRDLLDNHHATIRRNLTRPALLANANGDAEPHL